MEVEYKKDLRHSYMVITKEDNMVAWQYSIKMLENNSIEGILPVEQRRIDDKIFYYYEITAKQSMINILDKASLSCDAVKKLLHGILDTLERAYEYLLPEDDFVLSPEYIYMEVNTDKSGLCFVPGFSSNIKKQINGLLEYLMNKVDYNDKDAVLLVYQLYAISREMEYTFDQLVDVLQHNPMADLQVKAPKKRVKKDLDAPDIPDMPIIKDKDIKQINDDNGNNNISKDGGKIHLKSIKEKEDNNNQDVPFMKEKIEGEAEKVFYPMKNLILSAVCILAGVLVIILSITTGILYNTFGNKIDYSKLFAVMLIILCVEGYLLNKLLDKKNKITKIVKTFEYVDPRKDLIHQSKLIPRKSEVAVSGQAPIEFVIEEEDNNPTCLLNAIPEKKPTLILKALDESNYKNITISSIPFFIGKLKKNVDYCLENDVVSRYHAKISLEGNRYFITDLNSTNGTYVNAELLMTYQKKEINLGDEIAFANIKYVFTQF